MEKHSFYWDPDLFTSFCLQIRPSIYVSLSQQCFTIWADLIDGECS